MGTDTWQILPPDAFAYDVRRVVDAAYHFFDQPPAQKEHASDPTSRTGFRPFGIEYAQWPDRPDQMETFSICGAHVGTGPRFPLRSAVSRDLYEIAVDAFVALHRMASSFVRQAFQDRADVVVSREWVENNTITGSFLQINSYTMSANELRPAQDWHEDADLLTLGTADGAGLQVRLDDGGYVPVANVGGAHLAMVGEFSANCWAASQHRAITEWSPQRASTGGSRCSSSCPRRRTAQCGGRQSRASQWIASSPGRTSPGSHPVFPRTSRWCSNHVRTH